MLLRPSLTPAGAKRVERSLQSLMLQVMNTFAASLGLRINIRHKEGYFLVWHIMKFNRGLLSDVRCTCWSG